MPIDLFRSQDPAISEEWLDWQARSRAEYELFQTIRSLLDKDVAECVRMILDSDEPEDMARYLLEISHDCEELRHAHVTALRELRRVRNHIRHAVGTAVRSIDRTDQEG